MQELEQRLGWLSEVMERREREQRMLECVASLAVLGIKLNRMAWGEVTSYTIDDLELAAKASVALDHLLEQREQAMDLIETFAEWEFEMQARTPVQLPAPPDPEIEKRERERRRSELVARREVRVNDALARAGV
jgi:hypothetical protein